MVEMTVVILVISIIILAATQLFSRQLGSSNKVSKLESTKFNLALKLTALIHNPQILQASANNYSNNAVGMDNCINGSASPTCGTYGNKIAGGAYSPIPVGFDLYDLQGNLVSGGTPLTPRKYKYIPPVPGVSSFGRDTIVLCNASDPGCSVMPSTSSVTYYDLDGGRCVTPSATCQIMVSTILRATCPVEYSTWAAVVTDSRSTKPCKQANSISVDFTIAQVGTVAGLAKWEPTTGSSEFPVPLPISATGNAMALGAPGYYPVWTQPLGVWSFTESSMHVDANKNTFVDQPPVAAPSPTPAGNSDLYLWGTTTLNGALRVGGNINTPGNPYSGSLLWCNFQCLAQFQSVQTPFLMMGGYVQARTKMTSPDYFVVSDQRAKENIALLGPDIEEKILQLNGYSFIWKKDGKKDIGVTAQEVEKPFPELVSVSPSGEKSVEYMNLLAVLVEAFNRSNERDVEALARQQVRIQALGDRLEKIAPTAALRAEHAQKRATAGEGER